MDKKQFSFLNGLSLLTCVNITILELSMSIPSIAIGGTHVPYSTTYKGDSISTTIVQTSTSISTTIEPTSTLTTLVTEILSTHNSSLRENNTFNYVVPLSTFSESVTYIDTMSVEDSLSTAIFLPLTSAELTSSYSATWKEDTINSATVSSSASITLVSSFIMMSLEDSMPTVNVSMSASNGVTTSFDSVSREDSVSLKNVVISSTPELAIFNSMTSNEDIISTTTIPISNFEAIVTSYFTMSKESNILTTITSTLASNVSTVFSSTEIIYKESSTVENVTFEFYTLPDNKLYPELYVGMKTNVTVVAIYPVGVYENITIKLEDTNPGQFFDVTYVSCKHGSSINSSNEYKIKNVKGLGFGFTRFQMLGNVHEFINVSTSDEMENRQDLCNFTIFLHNANDLIDVENISLTASLQIPEENFTISRQVTYSAIPTVLKLNKTAFCELLPSVPKIIKAVEYIQSTFKFSCWIPFYSPHIGIIISDESETPYKSVVSLYNKLLKFGSNFLPGAQSGYRIDACSHMAISPKALTHTLSKQWVNREYYYTNETTDHDVLEFLASATLSESSILGANYTFRISVLIDEIHLWNTTVILTPKESSTNDTLRYTIDIYRDGLDEIYPFSKLSIFLKVTVPKLHANILHMNISTRAQAENKDPALVIQTITKYDESRGIRCNRIFADYKTGISGIQNIAIVRTTFLNTWIHTSGYVIYRIELGVLPANMGDIHLVIVETNNQVVEHRIQLNSPLVFQDTNGTILSELNKVFDKNYSSCIRLPVLENTPPLLLMKLNSAWLQISPATYNLTIIGEYISCQIHGQKSLQVSTASSSGGFSGHVAFCVLLFENNISEKKECTYLCQCQQEVQCRETVIFMANQERLTTWSLCEIIANNVV